MKRFTATEKWDDNWFRKLKPEMKCFWEFIRDRCDNAGVWKVDLESAEFFIGCAFDPGAILSAFQGRIRDIGHGRWWVPGFIKFQCGELRDKVVPHQKIVGLLKEHGIFKSYKEFLSSRASSTLDSTLPPTLPTTPVAGVESTPKEEEEEEDKEEEEGKGSGENQKPPEPPVEFPKGFPPDEKQAIEWARAGGSRATDAQIALYWNEAATRGGTDPTGQPITRWLNHCNARAIRNEGRTAEAAAKSSPGNKLWALKTQLEAVDREIKKIEGKHMRDEDGKPVIKPEDKQRYRDLKRQAGELNDRIAKGGQ